MTRVVVADLGYVGLDRRRVAPTGANVETQ
jgi:hypothetical protein